MNVIGLDHAMTARYEGRMHFLNEKADLVREAIDGVLATHAELARLDGYPAIKVVVRTDVEASKVAVISGGGAGHEPSHVGFVGRGMLTAAVSGEVFASPSVDAVLAAILAVTGDEGCLLIVKNYTGDRLNFGLAREKARALGKEVEMVVVGDDIALPETKQPRGLAGTLFVHKVAGHFAEKGATLAEVQAQASRVASPSRLASIGVALSTCSIPGQPREDRLRPGEAELGLGIHGEPGAQKIDLPTVRALVATMMSKCASAVGSSAIGTSDATARFALLVNNLGGVPGVEMSVITKCALECDVGAQVDLVVGPASLMTSLDMKGFSLSLVVLDDEIREALASNVGPSAWPNASPVPRERTLRRVPSELRGRSFAASENPRTRHALLTICRALIQEEAALNELDAKIGDGDTGSTLASAARAIEADLDALPLADPASLFFAISDRLSVVMGGSSGVLLAIFTAATGSALQAGSSIASALLDGAKRVQEVGGAKLGARTMLDALLPALGVLESGGTLTAAADAARIGAETTATMTTAAAGRASYVRADALSGVKDPGATAVATVLGSLAAAISE